MTRRYTNVAVLMGGISSERPVSLRSGAAIADGLRAYGGYNVQEIEVTRRTLPAGLEAVEAVFLALHGAFGEDGGIQTLLDRCGIPYTGSGAAASREAFDKALTKTRLNAAGIPTAAYEILAPGVPRRLPLPVVVKPLREGSSFGVQRVLDETEWEAAATAARQYGPDILVETFLPGRELTAGLVGEQVLPIVEIAAPGDWYDYQAKYSGGATQYFVPANLPDATAKTCQSLAQQTFKALGCRGFARVDFRLSPAGELNVLELNSIPGFTETSLLPKAAREAGLAFPELCHTIMQMAECDSEENATRAKR